MAVIQGVCKDVLEKNEWMAIVTRGEGSPHFTPTSGDYLRETGVSDSDTIVFPAGRYEKAEQHLRKDHRVQLLVTSKQVRGKNGAGQGCIIEGEGELITDGALADLARSKFSWAKGALVIKAKGFKALR